MRVRRPAVSSVLVASALAVVVPPASSPAVRAGAVSIDGGGASREYVVVYAKDTAPRAARRAVRSAGGRVIRENRAVGVATVRAPAAGFAARATRTAAVLVAGPSRRIGSVSARRSPAVSRASGRGWRAAARSTPVAGSALSIHDPLYGRQWNMRMIGASLDGSYRRQQGGPAVRVGILDTGVDRSHPDIRANYDAELSRNFTTDIPEIDGPCEGEPDASCSDPAGVDENGHGTHVAGIVGAPFNGRGISGVAPRVDLVDLRVGQDSGFVFLQPVVDALTHAADRGVDVAGMSFRIDPWLFNCPGNPADAPADQLAQQATIEATQRALAYARARGVTLVGALGDEHLDLGRPELDLSSPSFPIESGYEREIDDSCLMLPAEGDGVVGASAVGPSRIKAYYSNYGGEQVDLAAPGGDRLDPPGSEPAGLVLAPYPEPVLRSLGLIGTTGAPASEEVVRECRGESERRRCWYYRYRQGTGIAAAHLAGVAALIVAEHGRPDGARGGKTLEPDAVEAVLRASAVRLPCPEPRLFDYPAAELPPEYNAYCEGADERNGFYGAGIVSASAAVASPAG